jgi:hypothetical protein
VNVSQRGVKKRLNILHRRQIGMSDGELRKNFLHEIFRPFAIVMSQLQGPPDEPTVVLDESGFVRSKNLLAGRKFR